MQVPIPHGSIVEQKGGPLAQYRIRVSGSLGRLAAAFPELEITTETILTGEFEDQAALYGTLEHLRDFGVDLADVRLVESGG
jgi:hypothetical protein